MNQLAHLDRRDRPGSAGKIAICSLAIASIASIACSPRIGDPSDPQNPRCLERAVFGPPEQSPYVLPYPEGTNYRVFQTYCGPVSHGKDMQMSIDFLLSSGARVTASRGGIVRTVIDRHDDGGSDFNLIFVEHEDGTSAFYAHLLKDSAEVAVGDRIVAGQTLARSGSSGTSLPHLHFGVASSWPVVRPDDVPVNFRNARGPLDERGGLIRDAFYRAGPMPVSLSAADAQKQNR